MEQDRIASLESRVEKLERLLLVLVDELSSAETETRSGHAHRLISDERQLDTIHDQLVAAYGDEWVAF